MERYLTEYLFCNKCCPLPGVGELQFGARSATFSQMEQTMIPPAHEVVLVRRNVEEADLVEFISTQANITFEESARKLKTWCGSLADIGTGEKFIRGVGAFYIDSAGRLQFRSETLHSSLIPEVSAKRVVRKEVNHQILVGDKESSSVQMTEFFLETGRVKRRRWWIAAAIIGTTAAVGIAAYFITAPHPGFAGNRQAIPHNIPAETYTVPK